MKFSSRLFSLFRQGKLDADMAEEMRAHLELQTQANLAAGMAPAEARYAAQRQFGGADQIKETARDQRGLRWLADFLQDVNYGLRQLRRSPGFTAIAVLTLALGIGANSTIMSFINDLIVRPLLRDRQTSLVALHTAQLGPQRTYRPFNYAEFTHLRAAPGIFSDLAAMQFNSSAVGREEDVQRRLLCLVSQNYFSLLGVAPLRGRFFTGEETRPNAGLRVLVASYPCWQRMGGRDDFVGSEMQINGLNFTVIGVAPEGFGGLQWSVGPYAWLPLGMSSLAGGWGRSEVNDLLDARSYRLELFGRLRPGLTLAAANGLLGPVSARLNRESGATGNQARELSVTAPSRFNLSLVAPLDESGIKIYAAAALGMTVIVLLVACLNVANMVFSRGVSRRKEIAIRLSLGASRARVIRQLLVEGLLLALAGGGLGLLLNRWGNAWILQTASQTAGDLVMHLRTTFDWPLLAGTFAFCLLAVLVFGLAPALRATRLNLVEDLKRQGGEPAGSGRWARFFSPSHCVVMAQISLSLMLLFTTALLWRAVSGMERDRGFTTEGQLVAHLDYNLAGIRQAQILPRQRAVLERIGRLPGVERAALASAVPFNFEANWWTAFPIGPGGAGDVQSDAGHNAAHTVVSPGYFATLGIPLLRGRDFTATEGLEGTGPRVAIIDDTFGRILFGDQDPVGRHFVLNQSDADGRHVDREIEIIGLVRSPQEDAFQSGAAVPRIYRPLAQAGISNTHVHVKLAPSASMPAMMDTLRRELRALDPQTPVFGCAPLAALIEGNLNVWSAHFLVITFSVFGLMAVALAVVGIYGVKSYLVARRTHEIGIRIAIGARPVDVLALILKQGALQTVLGVAFGLGLALLAGLFLSKLLYRVSPADPIALLVAGVVLALVSLLACLVPALRATRINPSEALRIE